MIILQGCEHVKTFFEARERIFLAEQREDLRRTAGGDLLARGRDAHDPHQESFLDAGRLDVRL